MCWACSSTAAAASRTRPSIPARRRRCLGRGVGIHLPAGHRGCRRGGRTGGSPWLGFAVPRRWAPRTQCCWSRTPTPEAHTRAQPAPHRFLLVLALEPLFVCSSRTASLDLTHRLLGSRHGRGYALAVEPRTDVRYIGCSSRGGPTRARLAFDPFTADGECRLD